MTKTSRQRPGSNARRTGETFRHSRAEKALYGWKSQLQVSSLSAFYRIFLREAKRKAVRLAARTAVSGASGAGSSQSRSHVRRKRRRRLTCANKMVRDKKRSKNPLAPRRVRRNADPVVVHVRSMMEVARKNRLAKGKVGGSALAAEMSLVRDTAKAVASGLPGAMWPSKVVRRRRGEALAARRVLLGPTLQDQAVLDPEVWAAEGEELRRLAKRGAPALKTQQFERSPANTWSHKPFQCISRCHGGWFRSQAEADRHWRVSCVNGPREGSRQFSMVDFFFHAGSQLNRFIQPTNPGWRGRTNPIPRAWR